MCNVSWWQPKWQCPSDQSRILAAPGSFDEPWNFGTAPCHLAGDARPPSSERRRARRCGPRSAAAIRRRSRRAPSGGARGEPRADPPVNTSVSNLSVSPLGFCILSVNIRFLLKSSAELYVRLRILDPDVIRSPYRNVAGRLRGLR